MTSQENKARFSSRQALRPDVSSAFTRINLVILVNAIVVLVHHCLHPKN